MKLTNILLGMITTCLLVITGMMVESFWNEIHQDKVAQEEGHFSVNLVPILDHVFVGEGAYGSEGYIVQEPNGSYRFVSTFGKELSLDAKFLERVETSEQVTYSPIRSTIDLHQRIRDYNSGGSGGKG